MKKFKIYKINSKNIKYFKKLLKNYFVEIENSKSKSSTSKIRNILKNKNKKKYLILSQKKILGFIIFMYYKNVKNEKICHINDFFIDKKFRNKRNGYKFIKFIVNESKKLNVKSFRIEIIKSNYNVIKFWKKFKIIENSKIYKFQI